MKLGKGAREFIRQRIETASLSEGSASVNIRQDSFAQGFLADDAIVANFAVTDLRVKFLVDVPAVNVPAATGRLTGNSFYARAAEGTLATLNLTEGAYEIPRMNPKGGDFRVFAKATGEVRDIVQILSLIHI